MSASKQLSTSSSSLHKAAPATGPAHSGGAGVTTMKLPGTMPGGVKVGDRVSVYVADNKSHSLKKFIEAFLSFVIFSQ